MHITPLLPVLGISAFKLTIFWLLLSIGIHTVALLDPC